MTTVTITIFFIQNLKEVEHKSLKERVVSEIGGGREREEGGKERDVGKGREGRK